MATPTVTYTTVREMGVKHGVHRATLNEWVRAAKISPVLKAPYGRGFVEMFNPADLESLIAKKLPPAPKPVPAMPPGPVPATVGMAVFQAAMDANDERLVALQATCSKLVEQNVILLRTLSNLGERFAVMEKELGVKNGA